MSASWEEARRCPGDGSPGEVVSKTPAKRGSGLPPGTQFVTLQCKNNRCAYNETPYIVQIRPDGTIPDPTLQRDKSFVPLTVFDRDKGKTVIENLQEELELQRRASGGDAYEIRNPYA
jgi:hypothetical protein